MRRSTMAGVAAVLLAGAGIAACGDDGEVATQATPTTPTTAAAMGTEEFCEQLFEWEQAQDEQDLDFDHFDRVIAVAPPGVRDDLVIIREKLEPLDEDDPEAFGAAVATMFDPAVLAALQRIEEWGVEECGFDPDEDGFGSRPDEAGVAAAGPVPDDVVLALLPAGVITWSEVDGAFNYRIEVDGATLDTVFGERFVAVEALGADVVVEALDIDRSSLGPAPDVEVTETQALVLTWTEDPDVTYYVSYDTPESGTHRTVANSPFVIDVPVEEVEAVRFGPAVLVTDDQGVTSTEMPFPHGEQYYVVLDVP